jgi:hypothetical protein
VGSPGALCAIVPAWEGCLQAMSRRSSPRTSSRTPRGHLPPDSPGDRARRTDRTSIRPGARCSGSTPHILCS